MYIPNKKSEDGAEDRINEILAIFNTKMISWDVENAYWLVRRLRGNVYRKLGTKERKHSKVLLKELEGKRKEYLKDLKDKKKLAEFFEALEEYEIFLTTNSIAITNYSEEMDDDDDEVEDEESS